MSKSLKLYFVRDAKSRGGAYRLGVFAARPVLVAGEWLEPNEGRWIEGTYGKPEAWMPRPLPAYGQCRVFTLEPEEAE